MEDLSNKMIKIVHFVWSLKYGGIETMLVDIINQQVNRARVYLIVINQEIDDNIINGIDRRCSVFFCNRNKGSRSVMPFIRLNIFLWKIKADVFHFHSADIPKTLFFQSSKRVRTIHNTHFSDNDYVKYDKLCAISKNVKEKLFGIKLDSVLVYNGVNVDAISSVEKHPVDYYNFIQMGRLFMAHKGQHLLLKAIHMLVYEKKCTNFKVTFIGDGPDMEILKTMANELNISEYVCWLAGKSREYIYKHLCEYDALIQPSLSEGFGLTVVEGMCAKIPVLVCDQEGPMEVVSNGKYGMIFKTGNSEDLAEKMYYIILGKYDYSILDESRQYAENNFNIFNTANQYIDIYVEMLKK